MLTCEGLLERYQANNKNFLSRYVTTDKSGVQQCDTKTKAESKKWKHRSFPSSCKIQVVSSPGKILLSTFWDTSGIILNNFLQKEQSITGCCYVFKLQDALKEKHHEKERKGTVCYSIRIIFPVKQTLN